jgi:hypothetical protein
MHSRLTALVPGCLFFLVLSAAPLAAPRIVLAGFDDSPWTPGSALLQIQGAYAPAQVEDAGAEPSRWGIGAGLSLMASDRWWVRMDAARFEANGRTINPYNLGLSFGPRTPGRARPWVGFGGGYYQIYDPGDGLRQPAFGSSGNLRDLVPRTMIDRPSARRDAAGGYVGVGLDWMIAPHLGLAADARAHLWNDRGGPTTGWDGFASVGVGLTILLPGHIGGRWASR